VGTSPTTGQQAPADGSSSSSSDNGSGAAETLASTPASTDGQGDPSSNGDAALACPLNLSATTAAVRSTPAVVLRWNYLDSRAKTFEIARTTGTDPARLIATVPYVSGQAAYEYYDRGVAPSSTYTYLVEAVNNTVRSGAASATVTTPA
jgi:hypothetical protein